MTTIREQLGCAPGITDAGYSPRCGRDHRSLLRLGELHCQSDTNNHLNLVFLNRQEYRSQKNQT
jgi:hypothetical protein